MDSSSHVVFSYEKLDAYRVALEFLAVGQRIMRALPRAKGQLGDQLCRSSESVVLCIAEGAGVAWHSAEQKRFFRAARASAMECAAVIDICVVRGHAHTGDLQHGRVLLHRLVQMLSKLAK